MDDGACFKCRKDLHKGKEKYVQVTFQAKTRSFHPDCHTCSVCDKGLKSGMSYTVQPATGLSICEACFQKQHGGDASVPKASGGVSWTPKAPSEKGFVWNQVCLVLYIRHVFVTVKQVVLLDHASPEEAAKQKKEAREKPMGTCKVCSKKIYDEMIKLDGGKTLRHMECHKCSSCHLNLGTASYFLDHDKTTCEECVSKKFSNLSVSVPAPVAASAPKQTNLGTCAACTKTITSKVVSANGKNYCSGCLKVKKVFLVFVYKTYVFEIVSQVRESDWGTRCLFQSRKWSYL
jgi:hypothetical protein